MHALPVDAVDSRLARLTRAKAHKPLRRERISNRAMGVPRGRRNRRKRKVPLLPKWPGAGCRSRPA